MELFLIKLVVITAFILTLSIVAERSSPTLAGLLSGYPTGSALTLFWFGVEQSPTFAADSAIYNATGLVALQAFIFTYYHVLKRVRRLVTLLPSLAACAAFFVIIVLLHLANFGAAGTIALVMVSVVVFSGLLMQIPDTTIQAPIRLTARALLARVSISAPIIVLITVAAKLVGPAWAGLLSAFPMTLYPLILIVQHNYCKENVYTVIKAVPQGIGSILCYSLTLAYVYPIYGVIHGTVLCFASATAYMLLVIGARRAFLNQGSS